MTVSSETIKKSYAGNDVTTVFAYTWKIYDEGDLLVLLDGVEQTVNTDYTVSGVGDAGGGNVTMVTPPATGETLFIKLDLDFLQPTDWVENTDFPADSHEDAADRNVKLCQILNEKLSRAILLALTSSLSDLEFPEKDGDKVYIRWNADGTALIVAEGTDVAYFAELVDCFVLTGHGKKLLRVNDGGDALTPSTMTEESDHFDFKTKKIKTLAVDLTDPTELTIASGVVTVTQGCHTIDTEGDAASDDLDTVNGLVAGQYYFLTPANGARTVVLKHNTGNIWIPTAKDISLDDALDGVLGYSPDGSNLIIVNDMSATDDDAIHDNVAGEINAISEKTDPVNADLIVIEDSEDSNNKKKVQIGNLPAAIADIIFVIDGGGAQIGTGEQGHLVIDFPCEIQAATVLADQTGSIVIDIWKDTYANFPPTDADSITASAPLTISSAQKAQDTTLTGWTKTIAAGDILAFNVDSCDTIERCVIALKVKRT